MRKDEAETQKKTYTLSQEKWYDGQKLTVDQTTPEHSGRRYHATLRHRRSDVAEYKQI